MDGRSRVGPTRQGSARVTMPQAFVECYPLIRLLLGLFATDWQSTRIGVNAQWQADKVMMLLLMLMLRSVAFDEK